MVLPAADEHRIQHGVGVAVAADCVEDAAKVALFGRDPVTTAGTVGIYEAEIGASARPQGLNGCSKRTGDADAAAAEGLLRDREGTKPALPFRARKGGEEAPDDVQDHPLAHVEGVIGDHVARGMVGRGRGMLNARHAQAPVHYEAENQAAAFTASWVRAVDFVNAETQ